MSLKNDTFADLKNLTFALIGREYADTTASFTRLKSLWNYAAKKAYRQSDYWERFLIISDERTLSNKNTVPHDESGKDSIDTFLRIYKYDQEKKRGGEYKFVVNAGGALLTSNATSATSDLYESPEGSGFYIQPDSSEDDPSVFVTYKKAFEPDYGNAGDTEEIPAELVPYMAHLAAYTWQRSVEQNASDSNFTLSLGLVNSILEDELDKISSQNIANSYIAKSVRTNYNQTII